MPDVWSRQNNNGIWRTRIQIIIGSLFILCLMVLMDHFGSY